MSLFVHPNAEDILIAQKSRDQGIFNASITMLLSYDGRYATNIFHGLSPLAFGWYNGFKLMPIFNTLFVSLCLFFLLGQLFENINKLSLLSISFLFVLANLAIAPNLPMSLFSYIAALIYFLPWAFLFLWVGSFLLYLKKQKGTIFYIVSAVVLIFANGMSEMFLVHNFTALALLWVYLSKSHHQKEKKFSLISLTIIYCGTALFFVTSPGIIERLIDYKPLTSQVTKWEMVRYSLYDFFIHYAFLFTTKALIVFPVVLLIVIKLVEKHIQMSFLGRGGIYTAILGVIFTTYLSTLSYYLSIGTKSSDADRIYNTVFVVFFILLITIVTLLLMTFIRQTDKFKLTLIKSICIVSLFLGLVITPNNFKQIVIDFNSGKLDAFDTEITERLNAIKLARNESGCKIVEFKPLKNLPATIWINTDIVPNRTDHFWNRGFERYFYVDEVRLTGDTTGLFNSIE